MKDFVIWFITLFALCSCSTTQHLTTHSSSKIVNEINEQIQYVEKINESDKTNEELQKLNDILSNPIDTCSFYGFTFIKCKRDNLTTNGVYYVLLNCNEEKYVSFSKNFLTDIGVWRCGYLRNYGGKRKTSWTDFNTQRTIYGEYKQRINVFILTIDYAKPVKEIKHYPTSYSSRPRYYYYSRIYTPRYRYYR